jgi:hypothetical protein
VFPYQHGYYILNAVYDIQIHVYAFQGGSLEVRRAASDVNHGHVLEALPFNG